MRQTEAANLFHSEAYLDGCAVSRMDSETSIRFVSPASPPTFFSRPIHMSPKHSLLPKSLLPTSLTMFGLLLCGPFVFDCHSVSAEETVKKLLDKAKTLVDLGPEKEDLVDPLRDMQSNAMKKQSAPWGHWGSNPAKYSTWTNHSNRLIPLYTFGYTLNELRERGSLYSNAQRMREHFGRVDERTFHPAANYHDQVDVYDLQMAAIESGKRNVILMIFDGMDWQTTRAASLYRNQANRYDSGRGTGLLFQDYRRVKTDFAFIVTTPYSSGAKLDVNSQTITAAPGKSTGGFSPEHAGPMPWHEQSRREYVIGQDREVPHTFTDSASSATSLMAGVKTYNGSINVMPDGKFAEPIARTLQKKGYRVGVVTSVPVSHATPGSAYANNVVRQDYQDITRDLVGLPSSSHRKDPLPGLDLLIGGGWGEGVGKDGSQGENFMAGNKYFHESDREALKRDSKDGEENAYLLVERTEGRSGAEVLNEATEQAIEEGKRLVGFFGTKGGHLPFQTADGNFNPTFDVKGTERYDEADLIENPNLSQMTESALKWLSSSKQRPSEKEKAPGFWLLIEAGDVDWANHANNLDNSVGAVFSGEQAFETVVNWVTQQNAWDDTAVFVTSDHGHFLVIENEQAISNAAQKAASSNR
ncbi:alkaline phosphatase [Rhodopirellula sp. JC737]|uniref:alkaline phosphatase n=1 Tax=Rhodopirellula halodulae TaxID=2894198 RepID=UPI001E39F9AB|nr:alkaline phosphatase [Rhodopirellula sp. JC737]MCC9658112.1 alkaline phosphatase [Rhodopirellula sp. JC737]